MKVKKVNISFLITHYNRFNALQQCLEAIDNLNLSLSYEIVVSDDGSDSETIKELKKLNIDQLLLGPNNQGLAANLNKGIRACKGDYLIYCQEDFLLSPSLAYILDEIFMVLDDGQLDMVRLQANYNFPKLNSISKTISKIPKFSFKNFYVNAFQYSDNPFVTKREFYDLFGYYLEGTDSDYGETEFAIRIFKSHAQIGITNQYYISNSNFNSSVVKRNSSINFWKIFKKTHRFFRAIRLHFEFLLYNKNYRKLKTYKSNRFK